MNFYDERGMTSIGSRLRLLAESITDSAAELYKLYEVHIKPKWWPVLEAIKQSVEPISVTEIADLIKHSHVSVSKIIKELLQIGLIVESKDPFDGRKTLLQLSEKGYETMRKLAIQCIDVTSVIEDIHAECDEHLWNAIKSWENKLAEKSLYKRVKEKRQYRERSNFDIVPFEPQYARAFKDINIEWISKYFGVEEQDLKSLDHPKSYIIDRGGYVAIGLYQNNVVGTCALVPMDHPDYAFELAKMAVSPTVQGLGFGKLIGIHVVEKARELGARKIYLESNSKLKPALQLYKKLGFTDVSGVPTPYCRCDVQMELVL